MVENIYNLCLQKFIHRIGKHIKRVATNQLVVNLYTKKEALQNITKKQTRIQFELHQSLSTINFRINLYHILIGTEAHDKQTKQYNQNIDR